MRVMARIDYVRPQGKGQLRHWVSRAELRRLLRPHFSVLDMTTLTPRGHGGILRLINSTKLSAWAERIPGPEAVKRPKERLGCGWTIMDSCTDNRPFPQRLRRVRTGPHLVVAAALAKETTAVLFENCTNGLTVLVHAVRRTRVLA